MYGQKQILSCLLVVVLISVLNVYKSVIKRDKEIRLFMELKIRKVKLVKMEQSKAAEQHVANHNAFMRKRLEYGDRCYDLHALIFRPSEYDTADIIGANKSITRMTSINEDKVPVESLTKRNDENTMGSTFIASTPQCLENSGPEKRADKSAGDLSGGIIYVAVFILLVSLGKAAYDLSKQFKELQETKTLSEEEVLRRCSLQEYSLIKHKQKHSAKAIDPFLNKSGPLLRPQLSLDSSADKTQYLQQYVHHQISAGNLQDYKSGPGLISETGTPVKQGKLLAGRPAPLLRRCSVPVFLNQQHLFGHSRRPSTDSFSEDDFSATNLTETKRRVRMIQRH